MTFDTHIFISYGHVDNIPTPEEEGWVTRFHKFLDSYLSTELGETAMIWRDEKLTGNDVFSDEILKRITTTAAAVAVVSARYTGSEWCMKEADAFCKAAEQTGGLVVGDKMRLFPVALKPLGEQERRKLPGRLSEALGYPFYREVEGGRHERLDPSFGSAEIYKTRVARLAMDIADVIARLREAAPAAAGSALQKPVIYLAECGYDRNEDRERLWAELRAHGYRVVPEQPSLLPDVEPLYVEQVTQLLEQSEVAIHLMGSYAGKTPDGPSRKPVVELQNELAARQSAERGLTRVIWLPDGTRADGWAFLDELQRSADLQCGADLITGGMEDLKSAVRAAIKKVETPEPPAPVAAADAAPTVYVVCVEDDFEALQPLVAFLNGESYAMEFPVFSGSAAAVREANEAIAMRCDAAILFFGAGDGAWMAQQRGELQRTQSLRRDRPLAAVFTCLSGPLTADKRAVIMRMTPNLINVVDSFTDATMQPFLRAVPKAARSHA
jgi:hypothetical protein